MVKYNPLQYLPEAEELPDSDDTPVDNEFQNLIPNLLLLILTLIWQEREDWFFGVDMGIYHTTGDNPRIPIVPDGFFSLGVPRRKGEKGRPSYIVWQENNVVPQLVLEVVSQTYAEEYGEKQTKYARLGVLYYAIYNPDYWARDNHDPLEVYRLVEGGYVLQPGEPVWMPEIELGIGRSQGSYGGWQREWLYWYDRAGNRYLTPDERTQTAQARAEEEHQRFVEAQQQLQQERQSLVEAQQQLEQERRLRQELIARLRERGIDPDAF